MSDGAGAEKEELSVLISQIWEHVIRQVNKLISTHDRYGFVEFREKLNPKLETVVEAFTLVDHALELMLESNVLDHDETKAALNSKQCILKMRELQYAFLAEDTTAYERIIGDLKNQCLM